MRFTDVFGVRINDVVGSFDRVVSILSEKNVNILYCYSFYEAKNGIFIFSVSSDQFALATKSLVEDGVEIVEAKHFYK